MCNLFPDEQVAVDFSVKIPIFIGKIKRPIILGKRKVSLKSMRVMPFQAMSFIPYMDLSIFCRKIKINIPPRAIMQYFIFNWRRNKN